MTDSSRFLFEDKESWAMRQTAFLLTFSVFLTAPVSALGGPYAPKIGQRHPDITLADIATGQPVSLSDFRGKKVLLIHFASW
jgi:hypothetical protein